MSKKSKKSKSQPMKASEITLYIFRILVTTYVCVFFLAMPLFYHDKYYDIGDFKYSMFMYITTSFLLIAAIMLAVYIFILFREKRINKDSVISTIKSLSVLDWFMIAFAIVSILSYLFSPSRTNEFPVFYLFRGGNTDLPVVNLPWEGYKGWNMGLRSQLIFVALYFFISRLFMKSWFKDFIVLVLGSASIAFMFGVLHRFNIDPLGLYQDLNDGYKYQFISTLGQSSWFSSFMVVILPIGMALFMFNTERKSISNIFLGCFVFLSGATFVTQNSDSAYMAITFIMLILFSVSFTDNERFLKFWEMIIIMLGAMKLMGIFQILFPERATALDSLSFFISKSAFTWGVFIIVVAFYVFIRNKIRGGKFNISDHKLIRNILIILVIMCIPLGVLTAYLNTKGLLPTTALQNVDYFTFKNEWGNHRGFIWRNMIEIMGEPTWRGMMLLGAGPDCLATVAYALEPRASEMLDYCAGAVIVCAHNEWLNMLFNEGILGFISYIGIFISAFVTFIKKCNNPIMTGCAASVAAYFFHNFFCYQQILCTPMIFCIIGWGIWSMHDSEKNTI